MQIAILMLFSRAILYTVEGSTLQIKCFDVFLKIIYFSTPYSLCQISPGRNCCPLPKKDKSYPQNIPHLTSSVFQREAIKVPCPLFFVWQKSYHLLDTEG